MLDRLGWRQPTVPVVTVAGTNGKGSVSAYCAATLTAAGYRVGTFTSPHLRDYRERIRVHDRLTSAQELLWAFERIEAACAGAGGVGRGERRGRGLAAWRGRASGAAGASGRGGDERCCRGERRGGDERCCRGRAARLA